MEALSVAGYTGGRPRFPISRAAVADGRVSAVGIGRRGRRMPETWDSFFLGQLGATAALAGLLFVAVSINVDRIVKVGGLADRAFEVLVTLLAILTMSGLMLIPQQSQVAMGIEIVAIAALATVVGLGLGVRGIRQTEIPHRRHFAIGLAMFAAALALCLVGGIVMLAGSALGLYWVAAGMCLGIVRAVVDAWVLLVEINR